jgi:hypothetical protein
MILSVIGVYSTVNEQVSLVWEQSFRGFRSYDEAHRDGGRAPSKSSG